MIEEVDDVLASFFACAVPLRTSAVGGSTRWISPSSFEVGTPGFAATSIASSLPFLLEERLRGGEVEDGERRAADRGDAPSLTMPTIR